LKSNPQFALLNHLTVALSSYCVLIVLDEGSGFSLNRLVVHGNADRFRALGFVPANDSVTHTEFRRQSVYS
jgi:hypothetical protein